MEVVFQPGVTTILNLKLVARGLPLWERPDLGISRDDVVVGEKNISVTVHSLGAKDTQASNLSLVDRDGKILASAPVPRLEAPLDLQPRRTKVTLAIPVGSKLTGCSVVLILMRR